MTGGIIKSHPEREGLIREGILPSSGYIGGSVTHKHLVLCINDPIAIYIFKDEVSRMFFGDDTLWRSEVIFYFCVPGRCVSFGGKHTHHIISIHSIRAFTFSYSTNFNIGFCSLIINDVTTLAIVGPAIIGQLDYFLIIFCKCKSSAP